MTAVDPTRDHPEGITLALHDASPPDMVDAMRDDVVLELGWGRLIFGQTFADPEKLADVLREEAQGRRDICIYAREPHVLVARAPAELFIDPSHTYRLRFPDDEDHAAPPMTGFSVRTLRSRADADEMNRVYVRCGMVPAPTDVIWDNHRGQKSVDYLVAVSDEDGAVLGTVTGVDHKTLFSDPEEGSSLWTLAVDPTATLPGVGAALTRSLAALYRDRGRSYMDLSVAHDNAAAIALYEKLGFTRVPVMAVKRKNAINEPLFTHPPETVDDLNPYARIIADEAMRRGIWVEVLDAEAGEMRLSHGGRSVVTRESLSEYTSAVAMARCDDKRLTRRIVAEAGIAVPRGRLASFDQADHDFLTEVGDVVVKPTRGEQGKGITVGVDGPEELDAALARAREQHPEVLIEQRADGDDLRLVVIDGKVVAAALRMPAEVCGTGKHTIRELVETQSRRRAAATGGESRIPMDVVTETTVREAGYSFDDVLPEGERLRVRRTANLHQGGTIHDVTATVHPELCRVAVAAAQAIGIPVTGIDLLVPDVTRPEYVFIEANERPGLANHEPQPTAAAFVDFLFPGQPGLPQAWTPDEAPGPGA
ncbi:MULTISPECIES: N-acetylglutaminylglutamine synthetase [Mycolicibacterium]|jgi:GNAT-family acetyltransferase (TIGR03103 family)|uniref:GCN5-related N-acetyltransferase n=2 Tax=Mycolicibacterium TaxID=1866885 RepID=A1T7D9_MYCVP|nr:MULTISPECIES: N-acetylglutaminylglutamine synthetase [Mycolicibacterium]ABM13089.1 GCN5-related N-acetyltransferase [Mycolicibacterium vanbaalenii PYR-1]MDN4517749.1 N-acetylglutaminylglutamine synthetase [Mycolicibacterium austroafricanum]MDW5614987.1 N-acetylglutaminylglutamine synthetase [Mycolicibacterium sp. D5.8-2]PQP45698.1 N-acetylglutaminylglutamine synthetase [Mycolicibacterium austroafricanum]QRZ08862.1 N-acetylglutaminylglutamine synthetase [Mycolicibacterium austroafricanum]